MFRINFIPTDVDIHRNIANKLWFTWKLCVARLNMIWCDDRHSVKWTPERNVWTCRSLHRLLYIFPNQKKKKIEMCVSVRVEYPVTMMNCKTCVILYFSWTFNTNKIQEYRVSYYIYVIYVRGHVHHDDDIYVFRAPLLLCIAGQYAAADKRISFSFFSLATTTKTTANDCTMRRDDNEFSKSKCSTYTMPYKQYRCAYTRCQKYYSH